MVAVHRLVRHPLYRKTLRRTSKFMAHDEENQCRVGDKVLIEEDAPHQQEEALAPEGSPGKGEGVGR